MKVDDSYAASAVMKLNALKRKLDVDRMITYCRSCILTFDLLIILFCSLDRFNCCYMIGDYISFAKCFTALLELLDIVSGLVIFHFTFVTTYPTDC